MPEQAVAGNGSSDDTAPSADNTRPTALFVNENIGGHETVHHHLRRIAAGRRDVDVRFEDVPPPGFWRKVAAVALPVLGARDADLRPARYQLAQSAWVRRRLDGWLAGVDVVHIYTHNAALLSARRLRGVPYVVTLDSTNDQSVRMRPDRAATRWTGLSIAVTKPFERRLYRGAARVVANSKWAAQSLRETYGVDPARIVVLPMGVPLPAPRPAATGAEKALPRIVFIGRGMERKGGNQLLRVHQQHLSDRCELVLITRDDVPAGPNVRVLGNVSPGDGQVDAVLASADIMALPSRLDQWPNAVMEAMAAGVTPVVSSVGGMPEMVTDGVTGIVLADDSDSTLLAALTALLDDPARCHALGSAARQHVETELNVDITANRLIEVVVGVVGERRN